MARTNFKFTKRQKELDRKKKMEEKRQRKLEKKNISTETPPDEQPSATDDETPTVAS